MPLMDGLSYGMTQSIDRMQLVAMSAKSAGAMFLLYVLVMVYSLYQEYAW